MKNKNTKTALLVVGLLGSFVGAGASDNYNYNKKPEDLGKLLRKYIKLHQGDLASNQKAAENDLKTYKDGINQVNKHGRTPLMLAAKNKDTETAKTLLGWCVNVNDVDKDKWGAIHFAAFYNNLDLVKELVKHKATVNVKNDEGNTPLHLTEPNGEVYKFLVDNGGKEDALNNAGQTPLKRWEALAEQEKIAKIKLMMLAALFNNTDRVISFIMGGVEVNGADEHGWRALHFAAKNNNLKLVTTLLIKHKATVDVKNDEGNTPLHLAEPNSAVYKFLVTQGGKEDALNNAGQTPLKRWEAILVEKNKPVENKLIEEKK